MSHFVEVTLKSQAIQTKKFIAFLSLFIIPISGLSIDIYIPSLPAVSEFFGVDKSLVQLSITAYMIGLGLMQLFAGSISDSFGRRKPFLISMLVYIVATLLIPFVHSIEQLLFLRLIQGIAVAVIVVPMRSVISDLYEGPAYYKMVNYMTMAWSMGPIVAPAIGGYLQQYFGWQANFYFLAIYASLSFLLNLFYLPETSAYNHPFHIQRILIRYKEILMNKEYLIGLSINGILYSIIMLFTVVGPFLIQNILHYSAAEFGHIALLTGLAWFLASIINRFLFHISFETKAAYCFSIMFVIAIASLLIDMFIPMTIYTIVIPILLLLLTGGIIFPNYFARSMALFPKMTGSANALFGGFLFMISGFSSGLGTLLKANSNIPLLISYIALIILCLMIYLFGIKTRSQAALFYLFR